MLIVYVIIEAIWTYIIYLVLYTRLAKQKAAEESEVLVVLWIGFVLGMFWPVTLPIAVLCFGPFLAASKTLEWKRNCEKEKEEKETQS